MQSSFGPSRLSLEVEDTATLLTLAGPGSEVFAEVARVTGVDVNLRGNTIHLAGESPQVEAVHRFLREAASMAARGHALELRDVARVLEELALSPEATVVSLLDEVIQVGPKRRPIVPKTAGQRAYIAAIRRHDLTFGLGPAGTGKTYLAMAMAANALLAKRVKRIVLTRPAVEAGEKLGFLPGDLAEKVNPYLRPLYDALNDMMDVEKVEQLRQRGQIEVAPLAFMRGRTLSDAFVILDEAQNATPEQMRMFLTRIGFGSTTVVTGDLTQSDLPYGTRSGLQEARELLEGIEGIAFQTFGKIDVVRHPLVQRIIGAYEQRDAELANQRHAAEQASRRRASERAHEKETP